MFGPYVVHLNGALDAQNEVLKKELAIVEHMGGVVVIDMRSVSTVDRAVVAAFALTRDRLREHHGQLRLVIEDPALEQAFHTQDAHAKFDVYGSIEAAALDC